MSFLNILLLSLVAHFIASIVHDAMAGKDKVKNSVLGHVVFMLLAIVTFAGVSHLFALAAASSGN